MSTQAHAPKLSKPQIEFLRMSDGLGTSCVDSYPPFKKLLALGLVTSQRGAFGSHRVMITEAGRAALQKAKG